MITPVYRERQRQGWLRESSQRLSLLTVTDRPITWKEASSIIRWFRWKPYIARQYGIAVLAADIGGKEQRIVSAAQLRTMTPAQFWQRLEHIDPYRAAEKLRGIF